MVGQEIHRLVIFGGHLYPAYGDYGANTGPIDLVSVDLATQTLGASELSAHTEQLFTMRVLDGALYAPYMDPQGTNANPENGQLAVCTSPGDWTVITTCTGVTHAFGVAKVAAGLFLFGADDTGDKATVWLSTDAGETWTVSLEVDADPGAVDGFARFYTAAQFGDELIAFYDDAGISERAFHWDGSAWAEVDSPGQVTDTPCGFSLNGVAFWVGLASGKNVLPNEPSAITVVVHPDDAAQAATIAASLPADVLVYDAVADSGHLYLLTYEHHLWRGSTTGAWVDLGALDDTTVRCLTVDEAGGFLYFGTTDSRILRTPIPT